MIISNKEYKVEIPSLHPKSFDYEILWSEQMDRVSAGYWVSGKWMPGRLYYYINFHHILMNTGKLKQKAFSLPTLRDLEWEWFLLLEEARGFSGFDDDDYYTCHRRADNISSLTEEEQLELKEYFPEIWSEHLNRFKDYVPARAYLRKIHPRNMGTPIYNNEAQNFMLMSGRSVGKSYYLSAIILHEWLFDGRPPLHRYMSVEERIKLQDTRTSIIIGAGQLKKSAETMKKVAEAFTRLPGSYHSGDKKFVAPFSKQYTGNWETEIVAKYKKKVGGQWEKEAGTKSKIRNVSYADNPYGGQGDRNNIILFEEIGHFKDSILAYQALEYNMRFDGTKKFGSLIMTGTGGDFLKGGTLDAQFMFYNPEAFQLLTFNDDWEMRGKIAYFVPSYMGLNHLRDEEGIINIERAKVELNIFLEKSRKTKDRASYEMERIYSAQVPSEVFMIPDGNIFPILELRNRLTELEKNNELKILEKRVALFYEQNGLNGINYRLLENSAATAINQYPWPDGHDKEGVAVIYEFPIEENFIDTSGINRSRVPEGLYVIGHDPFRTNAEDGSLASIVVMKSKKYAHKYGHDEVVAVYYGRPFEGREAVNEILFKLSLFYNAKVMFENNVGNVKDFFEKKKRLDLLYRRPTTVLSNKDITRANPDNLDYGYPLSNLKFKLEALQYIRTWLLEERGRENIKKQITTYDKYGRKKIIEVVDSSVANEEEAQKSIRNLDRLVDRRLIQELISYNLDGNFDGVHGLAGCVLALEENFNRKTLEMYSDQFNEELKFISNNKRIFKQQQVPSNLFMTQKS